MSDSPGKKRSKQDPFTKAADAIRGHIQAEKYSQALRALRKLKADYEKKPELWSLWAEYHNARDETDKAETALRKVVNLAPEDATSYLHLAVHVANNRSVDMAKEILREGVEKSNNPEDCYTWLQSLLVQTGDTGGYAAMIAEYRDRFANQPILWQRIAWAAYNADAVYTALDFYRRCLCEDLRTGTIYNNLADICGYLGDFNKGLYFVRQAIRQEPDRVQNWELLNALLTKRGRIRDELLMVAAHHRLAVLKDDTQAALAHLWWKESDVSLDRAIEEWLETDNRTYSDLVGTDFFFLAELLRHEWMHRKPYRTIECDLIAGIKACAERMAEHGYGEESQWFEGWVYYFRRQFKKAREVLAAEPGFTLAPAQKQDTEDVLERLPSFEKRSRRKRPPGITRELSQLGRAVEGDWIKKDQEPAVGVEETVERMMHVLISGDNKALLLTGASGIGKTAAVRTLAWRLKNKRCPKEIDGYSVFRTSTTQLLAGAMYIGTWQERLEKLCNEGSFEKKVILYFEDIENIVMAGTTINDPSSFIDYLIPRIQSGDIAVIGEVNPTVLQRMFSKDPRLESIFSEVRMEPPTGDDLMRVLRGSVSRGVVGKAAVNEAALQEAVTLTEVFMPYRAFPGKAIDLLSSAVEMFGDRDGKEPVAVGPEEIVMTFCERTGVPDFIVDNRQLLDTGRMQSFFADRVLGQNQALEGLVGAVESFKSRLTDPRRPIRSLLFVGPTGVGKTESAKVLAEYLFGSQDRLIRLNMSEYSGPMAVDKLLAGPRRHAESHSSQFLDNIRRQPFTVVLLDEIEKADGDVLNLLLQLLDEGTLSDADGKPAFFQSAIIIMTSNIGARRYTSQAIGFGADAADSEAEKGVLADVREFFSPEIYNRFDEVVCFRPLSRDVLGTIINREVGKVLERRGVIEREITVDIDPLVKDYIVQTGYDPRYGARHIRRAAEGAVAMPLARLIAGTKLKPGQLVRVNMRDGAPVADVVQVRERKPPEDFSDEIAKLMPELLSLPQKDLARMLASLEGRIDGLKGRLGFEKIAAEHGELQKNMARPTFWDDPNKANTALQRYADLNRIVERVHRWEDVFARVTRTLGRTASRREPAELSAARNQLTGLLKDLESAEMEILLEGRHDRADAFILLRSYGGSDDELKWMVELAGIYVAWARRRGYRYQFVGERVTSSDGIMVLHLSGLNAFGLLKNERGTHRKVLVRKAGSKLKGGERVKRTNLDCSVMVLADVQSTAGNKVSYSLNLRRVSPARKGLKMRSLTRKVKLEHKRSDTQLEFYTDSKTDNDRKVLGEMFLSYLHYRKNPRAGNDNNKGWGSLVRTFESGDRVKIVDHDSGIVLTNSRDFLHGKIDSLLLERLI